MEAALPRAPAGVAGRGQHDSSILELEIETRGRSQAGDRRRVDWNDGRLLVRRKMLGRAVEDGLGFEVGAFPHRPVLEPHEDQALALSAPREIETGDLER